MIETGSEACGNCGSDRLERRSVGLLRRAGRWLTHGRPVPTEEVRCLDCGVVSLRSAGSSPYLVLGRRQPAWRMPLRLLNVVIRERTWQPNPALYLGAAAAGTVLGVVADLLIGFPWWIATLLGPVLVFVLSAVSAVRNPWREHPLSVEFLSVVAPQRYTELMETAEEERLRATDLPLYGLDARSWRFRYAGGTTRSGSEVVAIELCYRRSIDDDTPEVRIETRRGRLAHVDRARVGVDAATLREHEDRANRDALVDWLASTVSRPTDPPSSPDPAWHDAWRERMRAVAGELSARPWSRRSVPVNGETVPFDVLADEEAWVATSRLGGVHLNVRASRLALDEARLEHVDDIGPFLEGRRRLRDRHRGWRSCGPR